MGGTAVALERRMNTSARAALLAITVFTSACASGGDPLSPPSTGGIALVVNGLPVGTAAAVNVTGPGGFSQAVTATTNLDNLAPGSYNVVATQVSSGGQAYVPAPSTQSIDVPASGSRVDASVHYAIETGRLIVTVNGLPGSSSAAVTVTGPNAFTQVVTATDTLEPLSPGAYTIAAAPVTAGTDNYAPSPQTQQVNVQPNGTGNSTVTYAVFVPGSVNLLIDGMYLIQSVQSYGAAVPLVANRDAYLRVFVRADQANTIAPPVRVRLYDGTNPTPVQTYTIPAPGASTPTSISEGSLASSWNQLIPGALIQPNLRILADVDPAGTYGESNESDNSFPASGTPRAETVRVANPIAIRLVSVIIGNDTGNVVPANMGQFLVTMKKVFPLRDVNAELRMTPYTSSAPALVSDNSNNAWGQVLSEMNALRTTDGYGGYYYGVVRTSYGSGVAGIGYVPGRAAVGWDRLPSGDEIMAHEFGHNLSLGHAPCGGAGNPDPAFPHATGAIGVYGLDVATLALKAPSAKDLMGYCGGTQWISDYNFIKAFNYRNGNPQASRSEGSSEGLLVWGRVVDGAVTLEPAFAITAPVKSSRTGAYRVQALDAWGRVLLEQRFDPELVADQRGDQRHFAFLLPASAALRQRIATLRVSGGLVGAERVSAPTFAAQRRGAPVSLPASGSRFVRAGGAAQLSWNASTWPMAMVRDAATGDVLSFARNGSARFPAGRRVTVEYSDGVQGRSETFVP